jgi:cell wall-associated NlpC family hydrolase
MVWTDKYIGIPFKEGGRDPNKGLDCFGLIKLVYKEEFEIDLPDYNIHYSKTNDKVSHKKDMQELDKYIENAISVWEDIKNLNNEPEDYDAVLIRLQGYVIHIGIFVRPNMILHCYDGIDVVLEKIEPKWANHIEKIIRWKTNPIT